MSGDDLLRRTENVFQAPFGGRKFKTILADPPWPFWNRTAKSGSVEKPEGLKAALTLQDILALPVSSVSDGTSHLYLWVPNALLPEGLAVMDAWGFDYKTNIIWEKIRKDGYPDRSGLGYYFRNATELVLFGVRGKFARTLKSARSTVNIIRSVKREHSRKPDEIYSLVEKCSEGPYLMLFASGERPGWSFWGGGEASDGIYNAKLPIGEQLSF